MRRPGTEHAWCAADCCLAPCKCRLLAEKESALQQLRAQLSGSADEQARAWQEQQASLQQQLQQLQEALADERATAQQLQQIASDAQASKPVRTSACQPAPPAS
jgi:septal ring factor EnvC (AmiA/AmiB activator)